MRVIAYPNRHYPPAADVLALAAVVLRSLAELADGVGETSEGPAGPSRRR
jgi:hypothetical protein